MQAGDERVGIVPRVAVAGLVLGFGSLIATFLVLGGASLSYDEATYANLGEHPWRSDYYPEKWFVRHPPLYFLFLAAWTAVTGDSEWTLRLPSLAFSGIGVWAGWSAVRARGGEAPAAVAGVVLGCGFLALMYGLQATHYPLAFALAALGVRARVLGRARAERDMLLLLCLTHYFGYVFLALRLWERRRVAKNPWDWYAAPALWLAAAGIGAFALRNPAGPALGPGWHVLRAFNLPYELLIDPARLLPHILVFGLGALLLSLPLLRRLWVQRVGWDGWAAGAAVLTALLLLGPAFLRYALIPLPVVVASALPWEALAVPRRRTWPVTVVASAAIGTALAAAYVDAPIDPSAGNDIIGAIEWDAAAALIASSSHDVVAVSAPPAAAHYLRLHHGFAVADASAGPGTLVLSKDPDRVITLQELPTPRELAMGDEGPSLFVVPVDWDAADEAHARGLAPCAAVPGAILYTFVDADPAC